MYAYADVLVPMLALMCKKRLAGYSALGYVVSTARWPECGTSDFAPCLRIRSLPLFSTYFASFAEDYVWDESKRYAETIAGVAPFALAH